MIVKSARINCDGEQKKICVATQLIFLIRRQYKDWLHKPIIFKITLLLILTVAVLGKAN